MFKFMIIACLGLILANALLSDIEEWQKFKVQHHKLYQSVGDETHRYEIFKENLKKIREHNAKYDKGETSYRMGVNAFSDLTPEEFKEIYSKGVLPRPPNDA